MRIGVPTSGAAGYSLRPEAPARLGNMGRSPELTLGDLLKHDGLGLELVVGGDDCLPRGISGAHAIEIDHPAAWLDREWVMLTTGVHLSDDAGALQALIAELDEAQVTALGFGLDVAHHEVPAALLEEAARRRFPIFTVPHQTAFREVIGAVHRAVLSTEIRASNRLAAMQRFLMDALGEENPGVTVVHRLATLTSATVGVLAPHGGVDPATGQLPGPEIAAVIKAHPASVVTFDTERLHGLAFPIGEPRARDTRWLLVAGPADRPQHPLAKAAAQATVPLLAAIARLERAEQEQGRAIRRAAFEAMLDARGREEARIAAARALACGIDVAAGVVVFVAAHPSGTVGLSDVLLDLELSFQSRGVPLLAAVPGGRLTGILHARAADEALTDTLLATDATIRVGVGRTVSDPEAVADSWADAELAVNVGSQQHSERIVRYDDLDLGTVLINELPLARLAPKIERWLEPLQENPLVYDALVSYLHHDLDVGRTARALHLHPNSIRYRLSRAEQIMGARLRSSATIAALHVALLSSNGRGTDAGLPDVAEVKGPESEEDV
jgi:purine catabolism regulator